MGRTHRLTLIAALAGTVLAALAPVAGAVSAHDSLLVRIQTSDRTVLSSLQGVLAPVRVLEPESAQEGGRSTDGCALAWGDANSVEAARRVGIAVEVLAARRPDRAYCVVYAALRPVLRRFGRILHEEPGRTILEYPPAEHHNLCAAFELLPILDRPVVLPDGASKDAAGDLPPPPVWADPVVQSLVDGVSADSLLGVIRYLEGFGSRRSPEPECVIAADSLAEMLRHYGIRDVSLFDFNAWSDDVVGVQRGRTAPDEIYVICGHYDSISRSGQAPGADDNGTGTAAVIEAARILGRMQFDATIVYLAVAGEEQGLVGSEAWAAWARTHGLDIRAAINLDMVGWRQFIDNPDLDLVSNMPSADLRDFVVTAAGLYLPDYEVVDGSFGGGNSDQQSFWDQGYRSLTFFEDSDTRNPYYHSDQDRVGISVNDPVFLRHNVQVAIAALAELARPLRVYIAHQPADDPPLDVAGYPVAARIVSTTPLVPDSLRVQYRVNGSAFTALPLRRIGASDEYAADIPSQGPGELVEYFLEARDDEGHRAADPPRAPLELFSFVVGRVVAFHDAFDQDRGWTVGGPGDNAAAGAWVRARTVGTGTQPDAGADGDSLCFVTGNGEPGGSAGEADLDGGRTTLTSPRLDLDRALTAELTLHYWFADETYPDDTLLVSLSNDDGASWSLLRSVSESQRRWNAIVVLRLEELLPLTGSMRIRLTVADEGRASLLEVGLDAVRIRAVILPPPPVPASTILLAPWPQPFTGSVRIRYELSRAAHVDLSVFDVRGRRVAELVRGDRAVERFQTSWDGRDGDGRPLPSGVYFLRMEAGGALQTRRIVRVR